MKITETEDRLVLREAPVFFWIAGASGTLVFGSGLLLMVYYAVSRPRAAFGSEDGNLSGGVISVVVYLAGVLVVLALTALFAGLALSSILTTLIDRNGQFVEVSKRNLFRKTSTRYEFSQIARFSTNSVPVRRGPVHYVCIVLKNKHTIDVEGKGGTAKTAEALALRLNTFIAQPKKPR